MRPSASQLCKLRVAEAAVLIAEGTISSVDLVQSCLEQINRTDQIVRAWQSVDGKGALTTATEMESEAQRGFLRGPLHGVPLGIKDLYYTKGLPTTAGSTILSDFVPERDAVVVARLKAAGAIILGKTVTTEWAASDAPDTRNPWNLSHTPGGSSSGSGAAVAARMCPAATGTQAAGSVIRPASYNGVVGLKPTYGFLDSDGIISHCWSVDHPGILTRSVEDAALLLSVVADHGPPVENGVTDPVPDYRASLAAFTGPPRLGFLQGFYMERASEQLREHVFATLQRLAEAGAVIVELDFPGDVDLALAAHWTLMKVEYAAAHEKLFAREKYHYSPHVRGLIETGMLISGTSYLHALRVRRKFREQAAAAACSVDALVAPSAEAAPELAAGQAGSLPQTGDHSFQMPWSFSGLPAISIPSGLSPDGLPFGLQLIAKPFAEERLLQVASWSERVLRVAEEPPIMAST